jgi:lipopolysaccharide/colanic/teichoic acid biosynthesis glycosyltransferase
MYLGLLPLLGLFPFSYAVAGIYRLGLGAVETLRRFSYSTSVSFIAIAAASFVFKADQRYSRITFILIWLAALVIVPLFRASVLALVRSRSWWREPAVIFGTKRQIELTILSLSGASAAGYEIVAVLCTDSESYAGTHLARVQQTVDRVIFLRKPDELPVERAQVRNLGGLLGIEFTNELLRRRNRMMKRAIDIIVATAALVASIPLLTVCGVLIKLASPGPVFFRQRREGLSGRQFTVWKLRTMYADAEARLADLLERNPELSRQWRHSVKLSRDPRIIPVVGLALRRLSLDELPQLWSVITGEMSLVGPRPFPEYHLSMLPLEFRTFRSTVRPGLTGLWQVSVRSNGDTVAQERFDTYYIKNWSLWLDLYILARTVSAVMFARGAI